MSFSSQLSLCTVFYVYRMPRKKLLFVVLQLSGTLLSLLVSVYLEKFVAKECLLDPMDDYGFSRGGGGTVRLFKFCYE